MKRLTLLAILIVVALSSVCAQNENKTIEVKNTVFNYEYYRNGERVSIGDIKYFLSQDSVAYPWAKKARTRKVFADTFGISGAVLFAGGTISVLAYGNTHHGLYMASLAAVYSGAALLIASIPLSVSAKRHSIKAVNIYNENLKSTSYWDNAELNFGFIGNGIGLTLSF